MMVDAIETLRMMSLATCCSGDVFRTLVGRLRRDGSRSDGNPCASGLEKVGIVRSWKLSFMNFGCGFTVSGILGESLTAKKSQIPEILMVIAMA